MKLQNWIWTILIFAAVKLNFFFKNIVNYDGLPYLFKPILIIVHVNTNVVFVQNFTF